MDLEAQSLGTEYPPDEAVFAMGADEEAPPRSQEIDFNIRWSEEKRSRLARRICSLIRQYLEATSQRRENCKQWRRDWDMFPNESHNEPWPEASNLPGADTRRVSNAHHTRLNQQILLLDPPFAAVALDDEALAAVPQIEEALPALLEEADWQVHGDELHQEIAKVGNAALRVIYEEKKEWKPFYEGDVDEDMARALVMAGEEPMKAAFGALATDAEGRVKRELAFREEVTYQGVKLRVVCWEDMIILPVTVRHADEAFAIGERMMVTGEELLRGAKEGKFIQEAVDKILRTPPDQIDDDYAQALDLQGINPDTYGGDYFTEEGYREEALYHQYLTFEMCVQVDTKGDGKLKWCWLAIHPATETIFRFQYLPWKHGQAHYTHFTYLRRARQLWGAGEAELIAGHQDARTAVINQLIDHADLAIRLSTTLFVDDTAGIDPDEFELELGKINPCENVNGIKQLVLPPLPHEHAMLPDFLKNEIDLLTGATDPMMGKTAEGNPTLGEVQIAVGSGQQLFENMAAGVARTWKRPWDQVRWLVAQFGEGEQIRYRRSAMPGARIQMDDNGMLQPQQLNAPPESPFGTITSEMLRKRVDLVPAGLQHMSDIQTRIQQAQITWREVTTNPLIQPLLAANPKLLLMAFDYYLQQLRVPIRRQFLQEMEQTILQQVAQAAAVAQAMQQQQAGALDAQTAGAEATLQAAMADQGMGMGMPEEMAGVTGNGSAPVGVPA